MIELDQPKIFDESVIVAVSSKQDGQMQHGWSETLAEVNLNREAFLKSVGIEMSKTVFCRVRYKDESTYDVIKDVDEDLAGLGMYKPEGETADCLVTNKPGIGLFLPVADCGATIVHDPINRVIALAHLGRHNAIAHLPSKLIAHLKTNYDSDPKDLTVWTSPSIKAVSYIMKTIDFALEDKKWNSFCHSLEEGYAVDVQGFNRKLFIESGVPESQIDISPIDTATDQNYWSHYTERTVKTAPAPPRFAAVASLKLT